MMTVAQLIAYVRIRALDQATSNPGYADSDIQSIAERIVNLLSEQWGERQVWLNPTVMGLLNLAANTRSTLIASPTDILEPRAAFLEEGTTDTKGIPLEKKDWAQILAQQIARPDTGIPRWWAWTREWKGGGAGVTNGIRFYWWPVPDVGNTYHVSCMVARDHGTWGAPSQFLDLTLPQAYIAADAVAAVVAMGLGRQAIAASIMSDLPQDAAGAAAAIMRTRPRRGESALG